MNANIKKQKYFIELSLTSKDIEGNKRSLLYYNYLNIMFVQNVISLKLSKNDNIFKP